MLLTFITSAKYDYYWDDLFSTTLLTSRPHWSPSDKSPFSFSALILLFQQITMPQIIIINIEFFHISVSWLFFHWSLSDSKSINAVVRIVSTRPLTSKSSRPFNNPLVIVLNVPITVGTIVTFMFNSLARSRYLSFFSLSFRFSVVRRDSKVDKFADSLFFVDYYMVWSSGRD